MAYKAEKSHLLHFLIFSQFMMYSGVSELCYASMNKETIFNRLSIQSDSELRDSCAESSINRGLETLKMVRSSATISFMTVPTGGAQTIFGIAMLEIDPGENLKIYISKETNTDRPAVFDQDDDNGETALIFVAELDEETDPINADDINDCNPLLYNAGWIDYVSALLRDETPEI